MSRETRAMQDDDTANPGMLWVLEGESLWNKKTGDAGRACAECHGDARASMKGVAARHPAFDATRGRPVTLEQRVNVCRTERQKAPPLAYESRELLALTAYLARPPCGPEPSTRRSESGQAQRDQLRAAVAAADRDDEILLSPRGIGHQRAGRALGQLDLRDQLPARLVEHLQPGPLAGRLRASRGAHLSDEQQRPRRERKAPAVPPEPPELERLEQRMVPWSFADRDHPDVVPAGEIDRGQAPERGLEERKTLWSSEPLGPSHVTILDRVGGRRAPGPE